MPIAFCISLAFLGLPLPSFPFKMTLYFQSPIVKAGLSSYSPEAQTSAYNLTLDVRVPRGSSACGLRIGEGILREVAGMWEVCEQSSCSSSSLICCIESGLSSAATDPATREGDPEQHCSSTDLKGRDLGYSLV